MSQIRDLMTYTTMLAAHHKAVELGRATGLTWMAEYSSTLGRWRVVVREEAQLQHITPGKVAKP
jgi:hypothetical protein